jgi:inorganic pyrophosphatase/exopolyphosphatase
MSQVQWALHNDLKKFGLNPSEWTIEQLEERLFQIAHKEDKQFYFLGEAQFEGLLPEWAHLHLFSL